MITWLLIIIYLAFISLGLPDGMLGAAWPVIYPELGTSVSAAGILSMTTSAGTIVSSLMSGYFINKLGSGKLTLISCALTAAALLGFSIAPSFVWFIVLAIPLGLGGGAVDSALNHYVAEHYAVHHMNWLHSFWGVGATTGPLIMASFISGNGMWRDAYLTVAIIQAILVVILFVTLPLWKKAHAQQHNSSKVDEQHANQENDRHEHSSVDSMLTGDHSSAEVIQTTKSMTTWSSGRTSILKLKGVKPTLLSFLFYCGVEALIGLWGASYLVEARTMNADTAAVWIALYYGGITVGRFITGFISFKLNNKQLIRYGQFIALLGGLVVILPVSTIMSAIGLILIGLGLAPIFPGLLHETPARFGKENAAKLMGIQMAVAYTGSTCIPPLYGLLVTKIDMGVFPIIVIAFLLLMLAGAERVNRILTVK